MTDAHPADEPGEGRGVKDVPDHAICFALEEASLRTACDDAAGILTAVLEEGETLADLRSSIDGGVVEKETEDAAHYRARIASALGAELWVHSLAE